MLIALSLFFLSLFGGGSQFGKNLEKLFSDFHRGVEQSAANPEAVKPVEAMQRETREFVKRFNDQVKEFSKQISDCDTKKEEFEQVFSQLEKYNDEAQDGILKQREELKLLVTRDEWGKIFGE